jgi:hypothetical protein
VRVNVVPEPVKTAAPVRLPAISLAAPSKSVLSQAVLKYPVVELEHPSVMQVNLTTWLALASMAGVRSAVAGVIATERPEVPMNFTADKVSRSVHNLYTLPCVRPLASRVTVKLGAEPVKFAVVVRIPLVASMSPFGTLASHDVPKYALDEAEQSLVHVIVSTWFDDFRIAVGDTVVTPVR